MRKSGITILCIILVFSSFLLLASGCGLTKNNETTESVNAAGVTIDEQILVDTAGVKITATGIEDDAILGKGVNLLIENNSEINVIVECDAIIVNNYIVNCTFTTEVDAGIHANGVLYLDSGELEVVGIHHIGQIEVYFHGYENESRQDVFIAKCATIQTSEFSTMETKVRFDGTELVNRDGIRIVGKYLDEDSFWGPESSFMSKTPRERTWPFIAQTSP